jgi:hypothetical protein
VKNKIITKVVFKEAIQSTGGVFNDLSVKKHNAELHLYPQGVFIHHGALQHLIPFGNIKDVIFEDETEK